MLEPPQIDRFWDDGYIVVEEAITPQQLAALRAELDRWIEESRDHSAPYGPPTIDGRPRFDMADGHSRLAPALRRVNNPSDVAPAFDEVRLNSAMVDMVADLIGPDLKFHHCKVNLKRPGAETRVGYHQDFAYTPHTNDDIVTALVMIDDMTESNGCLKVVRGSHRGPRYSLFDGDRFTGFIAPDIEAALSAEAAAVTGTAGSVCLMHTNVVHGSDANATDRPRGLYICVYSAADAIPLAANPMPNPHQGEIVRGRPSRWARSQDGEVVELPDQPKMSSFFAVQEAAARGAPS
ncbi:MAG: phytanoyl-CoA dioxygenase family protein [Alphaproteobacteria bacterium]|nr:phytanoyl-CoA dioxygenase family protein [Alphaproteobacteria bacterium]